MTKSQKHVVIIGGSYAGILAAKTIFSHKDQSVKVTLVSASKNAYFNVGTPRLIVEPENIDKALFLVEDTLTKYSNGINQEFIHGEVVSTNFDERSVKIESTLGNLTIAYDYLIVASGSRTETPAFKLSGGHEKTVEAIKHLNKATKNAKKIIILGGGPTGVETAGELGFLYGHNKEIVLYTGLVGPLSPLGESKSSTALTKLKELGVKVVNKKRSTDIQEKGTLTKVLFEDGSTDEADVVIPVIGVVPNSKFLNKQYLDDAGYLKTDDNFRVEDHHNVLGLGDILSIAESTSANIKLAQEKTFQAVVDLIIFGNKESKLKPYTGMKQTAIVPISRKGGVGVVFGWGIPNFLVRYLKAKDFMISKAGDSLA